MTKEKIGSLSKEIFVQFALFFACLREFTIFGFRGVLCPSKWLSITGPCEYTTVAHEMVLLILLIVLMVLQLFREHAWRGYAEACKAHWLVFLFVGFAGISIIWSLEVNISFYKFIILFGCTLIAIYLGYSFDLKQLITRVGWFYILICLLSLIFEFFLPQWFITNVSSKISWMGVFTHRNHFGCFMALGVAIFLVNLLSMNRPFKANFYLNLSMLVVTCLMVVASKSATAIITTLVVVISFFIQLIWLRLRQRLRLIHNVLIVVVFLFLFTLVFFNLNNFLHIFGRNISLTGRVTIWQYLFKYVINQRLWLGYGYGSIWHLEGFIVGLSKALNFTIPIALGDSGYIDILLHLGVVGLVLLLSMIVAGLTRGIRNFLKERTLLNTFPILLLVYVIIANITMSLILESETFVWSVVLASFVAIRHNFQQKSVRDQLLV